MFQGLKARDVKARAGAKRRPGQRIFKMNSGLKGRNRVATGAGLTGLVNICDGLPRPPLAGSLQSGLSHLGLSAQGLDTIKNFIAPRRDRNRVRHL